MDGGGERPRQTDGGQGFLHQGHGQGRAGRAVQRLGQAQLRAQQDGFLPLESRPGQTAGRGGQARRREPHAGRRQFRGQDRRGGQGRERAPETGTAAADPGAEEELPQQQKEYLQRHQGVAYEMVLRAGRGLAAPECGAGRLVPAGGQAPPAGRGGRRTAVLRRERQPCLLRPPPDRPPGKRERETRTRKQPLKKSELSCK